MDEGNIAVNQTEATVTESAPVEEGTQDNFDSSIEETTEKSEITQDNGEDTQDKPSEAVIPKSRLDEVISERNELRSWREKTESELQKLKQSAGELDQIKSALQMQNMSPEERESQLRKQAADKQLREMGYVRESDIETVLERKLTGIKAQERFVTLMDNLSQKYDGKDGSPAFNPVEIAQFMDEEYAKGNSINDPERAYQLKYMDDIVNAKARSQKSSTYSEKPGASAKSVQDSRSADLEAAKETGDVQGFLNKYISNPFSK